MGSKFGGGGNINTVRSASLVTPAFRSSTGIDLGSGSITTNFQREGTFPQKSIETRFPRILGDIDTLRSKLTPGFSQVREARLANIDNARFRSIGNLRDNLARRRIEGSSFGQNALVQAEREFAQARAAEEANAFLEENAANQEILQFEFGALETELNRELQELSIAANLASSFTGIIADSLKFGEMMSQQRQQQGLKTAGSLLGLGISAFSPGGLFGGILDGGTGTARALNTANKSRPLGSFGAG